MKKTRSLDFNNVVQTLKRKLIDAIANGRMKYHGVDTWDARFEQVIEIALQCKGRWISDFDLRNIISDAIGVQIHDTDSPAMAEKLSSVLSPAQIEQAADDILLLLKDIPRKYDVYFPLPKMKFLQDVILAEQISIVSRYHGGGLPAGLHVSIPSDAPAAAGAGLLASLFASRRSMYLKVTATGYVSWARTQSAMHDAMAILKRVVQAGVVHKVLARERNQKPITGYGPAGLAEGGATLDALVYESGASSGPRSIQLGVGMSAYLKEVDVFSNREGEDESVSIEQFIASKLSLGVGLLTGQAHSNDAGALRSALEWAFDAEADDESIGRCIKTCIALEAALGDDSEERGVTERIADRVAYLVGNAPANRRVLRGYTRDFYRLRSNLVHGKQAFIGQDDQPTEQHGRSILDMVLRKELDALETWWRRQLAQALRAHGDQR